MLDICNDKNPSEGTTQSEVQCEGLLAVGGYVRVSHLLAVTSKVLTT